MIAALKNIKIKCAIRAIAMALIVTFIAYDISWAYPEALAKARTEGRNLAPGPFSNGDDAQARFCARAITAVEEKASGAIGATALTLDGLSKAFGVYTDWGSNISRELAPDGISIAEVLIIDKPVGYAVRYYSPKSQPKDKYERAGYVLIDDIEMPGGIRKQVLKNAVVRPESDRVPAAPVPAKTDNEKPVSAEDTGSAKPRPVQDYSKLNYIVFGSIFIAAFCPIWLKAAVGGASGIAIGFTIFAVNAIVVWSNAMARRPAGGAVAGLIDNLRSLDRKETLYLFGGIASNIIGSLFYYPALASPDISKIVLAFASMMMTIWTLLANRCLLGGRMLPNHYAAMGLMGAASLSVVALKESTPSLGSVFTSFISGWNLDTVMLVLGVLLYATGVVLHRYFFNSLKDRKAPGEISEFFRSGGILLINYSIGVLTIYLSAHFVMPIFAGNEWLSGTGINLSAQLADIASYGLFRPDFFIIGSALIFLMNWWVRLKVLSAPDEKYHLSNFILVGAAIPSVATLYSVFSTASPTIAQGIAAVVCIAAAYIGSRGGLAAPGTSNRGMHVRGSGSSVFTIESNAQYQEEMGWPFSNEDITGLIAGISGYKDKGGAFLGVGSFHNLDIALAKNAGAIVLLDVDKTIFDLNLKILQLVEKTDDFSELLGAVRHLIEESRLMKPDFFDQYIGEGTIYLSRTPLAWAKDEKEFLKLKSLIRQGRVAVACLDIGKPGQMKRVHEYLSGFKIKLGYVNLSSVEDDGFTPNSLVDKIPLSLKAAGADEETVIIKAVGQSTAEELKARYGDMVAIIPNCAEGPASPRKLKKATFSHAVGRARDLYGVYGRETASPVLAQAPTRNEDIDRRLEALRREGRKIKLSVVIPVYKEIGRLAKEDFVRKKIADLEALAKMFEGALEWEMVFVDDGCPEGSGRAIEASIREMDAAVRNKIKVIYIKPEDKKGKKGNAVRVGAEYAVGAHDGRPPADIVMYTDADTSAGLAQAWRFIREIIGDENTVAIGSRSPKDGAKVEGRTLMKRLTGPIYPLLVRTLLWPLRSVNDTQCGFKLYSRRTLAPILEALRGDRYADNGYSFDTEWLLIAKLMGNRIWQNGIDWSDSAEFSNVSYMKDFMPMVIGVVKQMRWFGKIGKLKRIAERYDRQAQVSGDSVEMTADIKAGVTPRTSVSIRNTVIIIIAALIAVAVTTWLSSYIAGLDWGSILGPMVKPGVKTPAGVTGIMITVMLTLVSMVVQQHSDGHPDDAKEYEKQILKLVEEGNYHYAVIMIENNALLGNNISRKFLAMVFGRIFLGNIFASKTLTDAQKKAVADIFAERPDDPFGAVEAVFYKEGTSPETRNDIAEYIGAIANNNVDLPNSTGEIAFRYYFGLAKNDPAEYGNYIFRRLIGAGTEGTAFEIADRRDGKNYALKVMKAGRYDRAIKFADRLRNTARAVQNYEVGVIGEYSYAKKTLCSGEEFASFYSDEILRRKPFDGIERMNILLELEDALDEILSLKILPGEFQFFVSGSGADIRLTLFDYGKWNTLDSLEDEEPELFEDDVTMFFSRMLNIILDDISANGIDPATAKQLIEKCDKAIAKQRDNRTKAYDFSKQILLMRGVLERASGEEARAASDLNAAFQEFEHSHMTADLKKFLGAHYEAIYDLAKKSERTESSEAMPRGADIQADSIRTIDDLKKAAVVIDPITTDRAIIAGDSVKVDVRSKRKTGVLVVGAGYIGTRHLAALKYLADNNKDLAVIGVLDRCTTAELAEKKNAAVGQLTDYGVDPSGINFYNNMDDVIASAKAAGIEADDIVALVATPNDSHLPLVRQLSGKGINKICVEKPLANTAGDIGKMMDLREAGKGSLQVACTTQFPNSLAFEKLKELIEAVKAKGPAVKYWLSNYSKDRLNTPQAFRNTEDPNIFMYELVHQLAMAEELSGVSGLIHAVAEDAHFKDGAVLKEHGRGIAVYKHADGMVSAHATDFTSPGSRSEKEKIINVGFSDGSVLILNLAGDNGYVSRIVYISNEGKVLEDIRIDETVLDMLIRSDAIWLNELISKDVNGILSLESHRDLMSWIYKARSPAIASESNTPGSQETAEPVLENGGPGDWGTLIWKRPAPEAGQPAGQGYELYEMQWVSRKSPDETTPVKLISFTHEDWAGVYNILSNHARAEELLSADQAARDRAISDILSAPGGLSEKEENELAIDAKAGNKASFDILTYMTVLMVPKIEGVISSRLGITRDNLEAVGYNIHMRVLVKCVNNAEAGNRFGAYLFTSLMKRIKAVSWHNWKNRRLGVPEAKSGAESDDEASVKLERDRAEYRIWESKLKNDMPPGMVNLPQEERRRLLELTGQVLLADMTHNASDIKQTLAVLGKICSGQHGWTVLKDLEEEFGVTTVQGVSGRFVTLFRRIARYPDLVEEYRKSGVDISKALGVSPRRARADRKSITPVPEGSPEFVFKMMHKEYAGTWISPGVLRNLLSVSLKHSIMRDLGTLVYIGLVEKSPENKYRALDVSPPIYAQLNNIIESLHSRPSSQEKESAREKIAAVLAASAERTAQNTPKVLADRTDPARDISSRNRVNNYRTVVLDDIPPVEYLEALSSYTEKDTMLLAWTADELKAFSVYLPSLAHKAEETFGADLLGRISGTGGVTPEEKALRFLFQLQLETARRIATMDSYIIQNRGDTETFLNKIYVYNHLTRLMVASGLLDPDKAEILPEEVEKGKEVDLLIEIKKRIIGYLDTVPLACKNTEMMTVDASLTEPEKLRYGYTEWLEKTLGDNLEAVVLYGSAVREEKNFNDYDNWLVVKDLDAAYAKLRGVALRYKDGVVTVRGTDRDGKEATLNLVPAGAFPKIFRFNALCDRTINDCKVIYGKVSVYKITNGELMERSVGSVYQRLKMLRSTAVWLARNPELMVDKDKLFEYFMKNSQFIMNVAINDMEGVRKISKERTRQGLAAIGIQPYPFRYDAEYLRGAMINAAADSAMLYKRYFRDRKPDMSFLSLDAVDPEVRDRIVRAAGRSSDERAKLPGSGVSDFEPQTLGGLDADAEEELAESALSDVPALVESWDDLVAAAKSAPVKTYTSELGYPGTKHLFRGRGRKNFNDALANKVVRTKNYDIEPTWWGDASVAIGTASGLDKGMNPEGFTPGTVTVLFEITEETARKYNMNEPLGKTYRAIPLDEIHRAWAVMVDTEEDYRRNRVHLVEIFIPGMSERDPGQTSGGMSPPSFASENGAYEVPPKPLLKGRMGDVLPHVIDMVNGIKGEGPVLVLFDGMPNSGKTHIAEMMAGRSLSIAEHYGLGQNCLGLDPRDAVLVHDSGFNSILKYGASHAVEDAYAYVVEDRRNPDVLRMSYSEYLGYYFNAHAKDMVAKGKRVILWPEATSAANFLFARRLKPTLDTPVTVILLNIEKGKTRQENLITVSSWNWGGNKAKPEAGKAAAAKTAVKENALSFKGALTPEQALQIFPLSKIREVAGFGQTGEFTVKISRNEFFNQENIFKFDPETLGNMYEYELYYPGNSRPLATLSLSIVGDKAVFTLFLNEEVKMKGVGGAWLDKLLLPYFKMSGIKSVRGFWTCHGEGRGPYHELFENRGFKVRTNGFHMYSDSILYVADIDLIPEGSKANDTRAVIGDPKADIVKSVYLMDELISPMIEQDKVYEIRYDASRLAEYQRSAGLGEEFSPESLISAYVDSLRNRVRSGDPKMVIKLIESQSRDGQEQDLISVSCYSDISKSRLIGEGHVNVKGDLSSQALNIVGMLNMALAASIIPDGITEQELGGYDYIVKFIRDQYKSITGIEMSFTDLAQAVKFIELPRASVLPISEIANYYRLTIIQLRESA